MSKQAADSQVVLSDEEVSDTDQRLPEAVKVEHKKAVGSRISGPHNEHVIINGSATSKAASKRSGTKSTTAAPVFMEPAGELKTLKKRKAIAGPEQAQAVKGPKKPKTSEEDKQRRHEERERKKAMKESRKRALWVVHDKNGGRKIFRHGVDAMQSCGLGKKDFYAMSRLKRRMHALQKHSYYVERIKENELRQASDFSLASII